VAGDNLDQECASDPSAGVFDARIIMIAHITDLWLMMVIRVAASCVLEGLWRMDQGPRFLAVYHDTPNWNRDIPPR
jgi:hypothetical protein